METMYDRLGDLLSETLEAGHVKFVKPRPEPQREEEKPQEEPVKKEAETKKTENDAGQKKASASKQGSFFRTGQKATGTIIKAVPAEVERAFRLLGVNSSSTKDEIRKAYKGKLQYYHPDKHAGNAILEKVATDKTRQVVESYDIIMKYLEK